MYKKYLGLIMLGLLIFVLQACGQNATNQAENNSNDNQSNSNEQAIEKVETDAKPLVTMKMADGGEVQIELYPEVAPNTVNNFIDLIEDGYYDGLIFHRVIKDFMIQGGDPEGTGTGGPGYSIPGEFSSNGYDNDITHEPGVLSMARTQDPDSAGSQFFIVTGNASHLDGDYAAFGKVVEGMDVVDEIEAVETGKNDKPEEDQTIEAMTVDLDGYQPNEVVKR